MTSSVLVLVTMTLLGWTRAAPVDANNSNAGVFYDQRQNGEYNIHVIVKDIDIVAFLGEGFGDYGDYDYSYDYHIPQNPWEASTTTQKTSSGTSTAAAAAAQNSSLSVTMPTSSVSPSEAAISTTLNPTSSSDGSTLSSRSSHNTTVECLTSTKEPETKEQEQETGKGSGKGRRRCSTGFVRDNRGRCRRLRRPGQHYTGLQLPFGLRLFPRPLGQSRPDNS